MFHSILGSIFRKNLKAGLLGLGLLTITAGIILISAAAQTTSLVADQNLGNYWRTTYDLLVRPAGARSPIEEEFGLVEANHLSGISGGITLSQSDALKSIPGVEVVAPIAMLGYVSELFQVDMGQLANPGAYVVTATLSIDNGARVYDQSQSSFYYRGTDAAGASLDFTRQSNIIVAFNSPLAWFGLPLFLAGIDPLAEAQLVSLDQALQKGRYLTGNEALNPRPAPAFLKTALPRIDVPALINPTPYISLTIHAELKRLALAPESANLESIMARGGTKYLASLPGERLGAQRIQSADAYHQLAEQLRGNRANLIHQFATSTPGRITYQKLEPPFPYAGLVLEIVMPGREATYGTGPAYRTTADPRFEQARFGAPFTLNFIGTFDIDHLPQPTDVNRVPLETFYPPLATLRYDETGQPVEPRTLRPTLNPAGYIQSPPLILTTLDAARVLRGDDCISAIRVRVAGIDQLTPASQRKIETIASEIVRRTGLTVDVMVGSSPRRVLVRVPEIGYVEEGWIQKGVQTLYQQRIQSGNLLLLTTVLIIGGLYTLDLVWADLVTRRRTIALQKALGWRSRTVFQQILLQALLIGTVASLSGTLLAFGLATVLNWNLPSLTIWVGVPLLIVGLGLLGSLYPAWLAMRLPPISFLRMGGVRYPHVATHRLTGIWHYAWRWLWRRWHRTLLTGSAMVLSSALLVFLLAVNLERQGLFAGTVLGEYILIHIESYHYALVAIGFGLAALLIGNNLLTSVLERQREIGILKAIGWRTSTVARLFIVEGILIGSVAGGVGTLCGLGVFWALYQTGLAEVMPVAWVGVLMPMLLGILATLYPARVAMRVPPAEAVRYE